MTVISFWRGARVAALIVAACGLPACASYTPAPLRPADELARLRAASLDGLRIERPVPACAATAGDACACEPACPVPAAGDPLPAVAFDPRDGLDEAELVAAALTLHPGLRVQRLGLGEARALLVAAGQLPDPTLGFSVRPGIDGASSTSIEAGLMFELPAPDERPAQRALADARWQLARAELLDAEWRLVADVRQARLTVLACEQWQQLAAQEAELAGHALDIVRRQLELGEETELALALMELEHADAARALRRAEADADDARRALAALVGLSPDASVKLAESGRALGRPPAQDLDDDELDRRVLAGEPALAGRAVAHECAEQELRLAVAHQVPRLGLGPAFERELEGDESFGLGVEWTLPLWNRNRAEIAERTAARDRARAEYVAALHAARARAFAARAGVRRTRVELEHAERDVTALVERTEALFEGALRAGELTAFEWLSVRARSVEARRVQLEALLRHAQAAVELDAATGRAPWTADTHAAPATHDTQHAGPDQHPRPAPDQPGGSPP